MRILLTGHRGYIGSVMGPLLVGAGHEVTGLDTDYYAACTFVGRVPELPSLDKDVRDVGPRDLEGFDAVVHLAALSNDPLGDLNPDLTYDINHEDALVYLDAAGRERFQVIGSPDATGSQVAAPLLRFLGTVLPRSVDAVFV